MGGAQAAGDFLLDFGHTDIAFGAVVGEWRLGVTGEAEYGGFMLHEGFVEIFGIGFGDAPALSVLATCAVRRMRGPFGRFGSSWYSWI